MGLWLDIPMCLIVDKVPALQPLSCDADADLSKKHAGAFLLALQLADRALKVKIGMERQIRLNTDHTAFRQSPAHDLSEAGRFRFLQPVEPPSDLLFDPHPLQILLMGDLLLGTEHLRHFLRVSVLEKISDLLQREVQHPQISDRVEAFKLLRAVISVAAVGIDPRRRQDAHLLIMAERSQTQPEKPCDLSNAVKLFLSHALYPRIRHQRTGTNSAGR